MSKPKSIDKPQTRPELVQPDFSNFPQEFREEVKSIAAKGGNQHTLDTSEEISAAADALKALEQKKSGVVIGYGSLTVGDFKFQAIRTVEETWTIIPAHLVMTLNQGTTERIPQAAYECAPRYDSIEQIAASGRNVFVLFEGYREAGILGSDENVNSVIFYLGLPQDISLQGFYYKEGQLFLKTVSDQGAVRDYSANELAKLPKVTKRKGCPKP